MKDTQAKTLDGMQNLCFIETPGSVVWGNIRSQGRNPQALILDNGCAPKVSNKSWVNDTSE